MNTTASPPNSLERDEPRAERTTAPVWLFILLFLLIFWAMAYFDQAGGWFEASVYPPYHSIEDLARFQPPTAGGPPPRGRQVFEQICALCHGVDGAGKPNQAPTFIGSEWVLGSPNRMIPIPIFGLN